MALTKLNFGGSGLSSLPTGSIIQFQSGTVLTAATTDTSGDFSNADSDTGITLNITPTDASSKIYLVFTGTFRNGSANSGGYLKLVRDSTDIYLPANPTQNGVVFYDSNSGTRQHTITLNYVDSPNTTSQVTYKVFAAKMNAGTLTLYGNNAFYAYEIKQ